MAPIYGAIPNNITYYKISSQQWDSNIEYYDGAFQLRPLVLGFNLTYISCAGQELPIDLLFHLVKKAKEYYLNVNCAGS